MTNTHAPILVPVDGSEAALRAASFAAELAKSTGRPLELVAVLDIIQLDPDAGLVISEEQKNTVRGKFRSAVLDVHTAALPKDAGVTTTLLEGRPTQALLAHIERSAPYAVVVGRTGKGAVERLFQGSVSRALTERSTSPVLVIP